MRRTALLTVLVAALCAAVADDSSGAAPSKLNLRSTASAVTGSWTLDGSTGAADSTSTGNIAVNNLSIDDNWYVFAPGTKSSTQIASLPTTPNQTGWIFDPGGATSFPAGNWSFTVKTIIPGPSPLAGAAVLAVGMWKGTVSGSVFTPSGSAVLLPTDDPATQNLRSRTIRTTTVSYSLPALSLGAGETLFVELWRHQVNGLPDGNAQNRELDLVINDGTSFITPPGSGTGPTHALSINALTGRTSFNSGTSTLYYNGSAGGSFSVNDALTDSGSGPKDVTYPLVSAAGWTHAAQTVATAPSFTSSTYVWTAGSTTSPGAQSIVGENNALQSSTATLTITNDTTAPSGQRVALSGGPSYSTLSVPLTLSNGSDTGAGVDATSGLVERASATLSGSTCGAFGSYAAVTPTSGADTSVAAGNCYHYRYTISDLVGNSSGPSVPSADAMVSSTATGTSSSTSSKVDATPPTRPTLTFSGMNNTAASGSVVYYRPTGSGSFTVTASSTDPESGVTSYTFPTISGFTMLGAGSSRMYSYTTAPSAPLAPLTVTSKNGAGAVSSPGSFTLVPDPTPPTVTVRCNNAPCRSTVYPQAVTVTMSASDGDGDGSGVETVRYSTDGTSPTAEDGTEYVNPLSVRSLTQLKVRVYDKVGNASPLVTLTVRSGAQRIVFTAPARVNVRASSRYLQARVSTSRKTIVAAVLTGPGLRTGQRWRFILDSGASIVQLRLPAAFKRTGRYTLVWHLTAGSQKATKTSHIYRLAAAHRAKKK